MNYYTVLSYDLCWFTRVFIRLEGFWSPRSYIKHLDFGNWKIREAFKQIPFDELAKKGGFHVDAWWTLCTVCQDFKHVCCSHCLSLNQESICHKLTGPKAEGRRCSMFFLHFLHILWTRQFESIVSKMVGSGPGVMMYDRVLFTCKVLTETETWILNGCHIFFWSLSWPHP